MTKKDHEHGSRSHHKAHAPHVDKSDDMDARDKESARMEEAPVAPEPIVDSTEEPTVVVSEVTEIPDHVMTSTVQHAGDAHPIPLASLVGVKPTFMKRCGEPGYAEAFAGRLRAAGYPAKVTVNEKPTGDAIEFTCPIEVWRPINEKLATDWDAGKRS